jgi:hypothetical protein
MRRRAVAWVLLVVAYGLIVAGTALYDWRAALIVAGGLLLAVLFGPDVA